MPRRTVGWALLGYGLAGVVLLIVGAIAGMDAAARIERTAVVAGGTLSAAARATRAAADSFTSIDGSLADAQASADTAADLSRDASATLDSLALAKCFQRNLQILELAPQLRLLLEHGDE